MHPDDLQKKSKITISDHFLVMIVLTSGGECFAPGPAQKKTQGFKQKPGSFLNQKVKKNTKKASNKTCSIQPARPTARPFRPTDRRPNRLQENQKGFKKKQAEFFLKPFVFFLKPFFFALGFF